MKKAFLTLVSASLLSMGAAFGQISLLQFDFSGATNTSASDTRPSTYSAEGILGSVITRGASISANNAANSFRGTGFSNDGISVTNNDYFQFTITAAPLTSISVTSIYGNFNGTASFSNNSGVTMAYAYSLDGGATFNLMSTFVRVGSGTYTYVIPEAHQLALQDLSSVTFRLFASGQTTTGGWGLQSAAAPGTIGLEVLGVVTPVPEPHEYAVAMAGLLLAVVVMRHRARA